MELTPWRDVMCDTLCMQGKTALKWTSAGRKGVIPMPRNRAISTISHRAQVKLITHTKLSYKVLTLKLDLTFIKRKLLY